MTLSKNIRYLRLKAGMSQDELASRLNYKSYTTIQKWETGVSEPPLKTLDKLATIFNVDIDDLAKRDLTKGLILTAPYGAAVDGMHGMVKYGISPITTKHLPLLGEVACGEPIFASEDRKSYVEVGTDVKADFCLRAKGDSMIGARIHDGDIVFVQQSSIVDNGDIAVVIVGDEATLKRFYLNRESEQLVLQAENPNYPPLVYTGEQMSNIRVLGRAIAFQSDIR